MASDPKISDEMVDAFNEAFNEACDHPDEMGPNDAARAGLAAALTASGYRERIEAAELVCSLYGITGWGGPKTERAKATTQAWMDWHHAYGSLPRPEELPVAELAARRDEIRTRTLARLNPASATDQAGALPVAAGSESHSLEAEEQDRLPGEAASCPTCGHAAGVSPNGRLASHFTPGTYATCRGELADG